MDSTVEHNNEYVFRINGHTIEVEFKDLTGETMAAVRDEIRKDNYARAEILALGGAIETLSRDEKPIIRKPSRAERRSGTRMSDDDGIPNDYDKDTDELLIDKLLKIVVKRDPNLAVMRTYKDVFAQYADEDAPKEDPTVLHDATKKVS